MSFKYTALALLSSLHQQQQNEEIKWKSLVLIFARGGGGDDDDEKLRQGKFSVIEIFMILFAL